MTGSAMAVRHSRTTGYRPNRQMPLRLCGPRRGPVPCGHARPCFSPRQRAAARDLRGRSRELSHVQICRPGRFNGAVPLPARSSQSLDESTCRRCASTGSSRFDRGATPPHERAPASLERRHGFASRRYAVAAHRPLWSHPSRDRPSRRRAPASAAANVKPCGAALSPATAAHAAAPQGLGLRPATASSALQATSTGAIR